LFAQAIHPFFGAGACLVAVVYNRLSARLLTAAIMAAGALQYPARLDASPTSETEVHDRSWFRKGSLSIDTECPSQIQSFETPSTVAPNSPGSARSGFLGLGSYFEDSPRDAGDEERSRGRKLCWGLSLDSPSSCGSASFEQNFPCVTPSSQYSKLERITGDVGIIFFDFDGTLTSIPGEAARGVCKQEDLLRRAPMLEPHLQSFGAAGIVLGIISKSTSTTIQSALQAAGLLKFFDGPVIAKATGFEGKAGFIKDVVNKGTFRHLGVESLDRILLVDDDTFELERACEDGIQTYPVSGKRGLQNSDLLAISLGIGI